MPTVHRPGLLVAGLLALVLGYLLRRWSARHDLAGAVTGAAWQAVKKRDVSAIANEVKGKVDTIAAAGSRYGQAKAAGGMVARHFMAQAAGVAGLIAILGGLVLAALGVLWR